MKEPTLEELKQLLFGGNLIGKLDTPLKSKKTLAIWIVACSHGVSAARDAYYWWEQKTGKLREK